LPGFALVWNVYRKTFESGVVEKMSRKKRTTESLEKWGLATSANHRTGSSRRGNTYRIANTTVAVYPTLVKSSEHVGPPLKEDGSEIGIASHRESLKLDRLKRDQERKFVVDRVKRPRKKHKKKHFTKKLRAPISIPRIYWSQLVAMLTEKQLSMWFPVHDPVGEVYEFSVSRWQGYHTLPRFGRYNP
jgi:hypothetical protein